MDTAAHEPDETVLVRVSGPDDPGITTDLMTVLELAGLFSLDSAGGGLRRGRACAANRR